MTIATKDQLFAPRLTEEEFDVEGVGTVRIRALSRAQVLAFRGRKVAEAAEIERVLIASSLVDPVLTEEEVGRWQEASAAGELEPLTQAISRLSGLDTAAAKEAVKRFRG